jgi:hypothetical protein
MKLTVNMPHPVQQPPPTFTIELTMEEATALNTLIGKYQTWKVSKPVNELFNALWAAGAKYDTALGVIASDNLNYLYGYNS